MRLSRPGSSCATLLTLGHDRMRRRTTRLLTVPVALSLASPAAQGAVGQRAPISIVAAMAREGQGDLELVVSRLSVAGTDRRTVTPYLLPIDHQLIGRHPGQLVRVHGRVTRTGYSEGGQWLRLRGTSAGRADSLTLWVPANHGASITFAGVQPSDSIIATGIVSAYQDNAEDPVVWQIVPRDTSDIVIAEADRPLPSWLGWAALVSLLATSAAILVGCFTARGQLGPLWETEARYRQLLALLPDAVIVHAQGRIRFANPAAATLLRVGDDDLLVGRAMEDYVHPDSRAALLAAGDGEREAKQPTRFRARLVDIDGGAADVEVTSSPCIYQDEPALVLLARDITAQLRYERDLHALALVDDLTGLQNRRGFTLFAEQELARARRHGRTPMLVFADLDGLKQINDGHGHAAGDDALRQVANALRSVLRESDIVARWSGDEFVALMGEGGETAAESIAARLNAALAAHAPAGQPFAVTASVGMSALAPELPLTNAMERADAELYATRKRELRSGTTAAIAAGDDTPGTR